MLSSTKRRIALLERSIELPITERRFLAGVENQVRLTGASFDDVLRCSLASLSYENLCRLEEEVTRRLISGGVAIDVTGFTHEMMPSETRPEENPEAGNALDTSCRR